MGRLVCNRGVFPVPAKTERLYSTSPGSIHGWIVRESRDIPDFSAHATLLEHSAGKCKYLHINRKDSNNVFSVSFPTTPMDNSGAPHILEHTVLCGSKKYPVRDPFFKMLNRSLSSYMNAWTASDYTMYPFSTTNIKDLKNLRDVYFDAVFHPRLNLLDFCQEGWRLEFEKMSDPKSPLAIKGVVYNEMKGALTDSDAVFSSHLPRHLYPSTPYAYESGGDPAYIPDLTHQALLSFYRVFYHPSRAYFFSYGDYPMEDHLFYVNERLSEIINDGSHVRCHDDASCARPTIDSIPKENRTASIKGPVDPLGPPIDQQLKYLKSFITNDIIDHEKAFHMYLLSYLLVNGPSSPMYKALISTNIGSEYAPNTGYDTSSRFASFGVGLSGLSESKIRLVDSKIMQVLEETAKIGFPDSRIQGLLHSFELSLKHQSARFGLGVAQNLMQDWIHGCNPIDLLQVNTKIESFSNLYKKGNFFESLIQECLLDNPRALSLTMTPDPSFSSELLLREQQKLEKIRSNLSEGQVNEIIRVSTLLQKSQATKEDISVLPCLSIKDIPSGIRNKIKWNTSESKNLKIFSRTDSASNDLVYVRFTKDIFEMEREEKMFFPLLCEIVSDIGVKSLPIDVYDDQVKLYTGGISISDGITIDLRGNHKDARVHAYINKYSCQFNVSSYAMAKNVPKMFDLLLETVSNTNFGDYARLKTIVLNSASSMIGSIADAGHAYATSYASASLSQAMMDKEIMSGLSQVFLFERLSALLSQSDSSQEAEKNLSLFLDNLSNKLVKRPSFVKLSSLGPDTKSIEKTNELMATLALSLEVADETASPSKNGISLDGLPVPDGSNTYFVFPFPVSSTSSCCLTVPWAHPDSPRFKVTLTTHILASILSSKFLHREIREKNGAYGGGASFSETSGVLFFYSYRDPMPLETLDSFIRSVEWFMSASDGDLSSQGDKLAEQDLLEAKLTIFKGLDAPEDISSQGMSFVTYGLTDEEKEARRRLYLSVTISDLRDLVQRWFFSEEKPLSKIFSSVIIGGNHEMLEKELSNRQWTVINRSENGQ